MRSRNEKAPKLLQQLEGQNGGNALHTAINLPSRPRPRNRVIDLAQRHYNRANGCPNPGPRVIDLAQRRYNRAMAAMRRRAGR